MFPTLTLANNTIVLYDALNVLSWFALYAFNLLQWKKKQKIMFIGSKVLCKMVDKKVQHNKKIFNICIAFLIIAETGALSALQFFPGVSLNKAIGETFVYGIAVYYGMLFFAPIIFMLACALLGIPALKQLDIFTPGYPMALVFTKLACFCDGCCYGIEYENGIFNYFTGNIEFPIQLVESGIAVILFIIILIYEKRKHTEGTVYPLYVFLYCSITYCVSFFRRDVPALLGKINVYHIFCLIGIVLSAIEFFIISKLLPKVKWLKNGINYEAIFERLKNPCKNMSSKNE